jgi:hypothetical protein
MLVIFSSYGHVPEHRQCETIAKLGDSVVEDGTEDKLASKIAASVIAGLRGEEVQ